MSDTIDGRGSEDQKILFEYLKQIYPNQKIYYEFLIHDLNIRLDLYLPYLGLAIEYDGRQHTEFVAHFHKDLLGFEVSKFQDKKKNSYLTDKGIKLLRINYNNMVKNCDELIERINSLPDLGIDYEILEELNVNKKNKLKKQSEQRKDYYKKLKKEKKS